MISFLFISMKVESPGGGGVGGWTPILKVTGILVGKLKLNS